MFNGAYLAAHEETALGLGERTAAAAEWGETKTAALDREILGRDSHLTGRLRYALLRLIRYTPWRKGFPNTAARCRTQL
jgi:hypothetical protein